MLFGLLSAQGDLIYRKYCEIQKLLMDSLATFGILPEASSAPSGFTAAEPVDRIGRHVMTTKQINTA
jgi:hypothetical protein